MLHYGDIRRLSGYDLPIVDVITGGSPCQDLSAAGTRKGLKGDRGNLFLEQIRIIREMRENDRNTNGRTDGHIRPRYMVWENVPGAFSSNKRQDFGRVLTEIVRIANPEAPDVPVPDKWGGAGGLYDEMGRWSVAWRVHDAQFWGVPQRRKRIALVADFGGITAPEILFERKGLHLDSQEGKEAGEKIAAGTGESADRTVYVIQGNAIDRADTAGCNGRGWREDKSYTLNTIDRPAVFDARGNGGGRVAPTMTGAHNARISDYTAIVLNAQGGV